jgi:hypothetical protein
MIRSGYIRKWYLDDLIAPTISEITRKKIEENKNI